MDLKNAEGWNQVEDDWLFFLSLNRELCLVAYIDKQIVGTVTAIDYNGEVAWIGMMLVNQSFRNRGIGSSLLRAILDKLGYCKSIKLDASPLGNPVYRKYGFLEELELQRLIAKKLIPCSENVSETYIQHASEKDLKDIIEFDRTVFGTSRLRMIVFLIRQRSREWWIAKKQGRVIGIVGLKQGMLYHHIGPLYAESLDLAQNLIIKSIRGIEGLSVIMDIHVGKSEFREWLQPLGFESQRPFHRMYLKQNPLPGIVDWQYAICGPEFG